MGNRGAVSYGAAIQELHPLVNHRNRFLNRSQGCKIAPWRKNTTEETTRSAVRVGASPASTIAKSHPHHLHAYPRPVPRDVSLALSAFRLAITTRLADRGPPMPPALRTHMKDFWDDASPRRGDFSRRAPLGDSCIPLTNASPKGTRRKTRRPGMGRGRGHK